MNGGDSRGGGVKRPQKMIKKGTWSPQEDEILREYVRTHGEGNWNAVHRQTRLQRCGKSCRLRWANHLRPNLKKEAFSLEEESLIVQLHAEHGNKWALMASRLPGRTDNEIKNFWNTRMKRLKRVNLSIYPRRFLCALSTESGPSNPSLTYGNAQPHPGFFRASSSQWNWPKPSQLQHHQLHAQSTIDGLRNDLSAFCTESNLPSSTVGVEQSNLSVFYANSHPPSWVAGMEQSNIVEFHLPSWATSIQQSNIVGLQHDINVFCAESHLPSWASGMDQSNIVGLRHDLSTFCTEFHPPSWAPGVELPSIQTTLLGATFPSSSRAHGFFTSSSKERNSGLLGDVLAESETLALKEKEKMMSESSRGNGAEVAASSSFTIDAEPTEELIDETKCMDDDLSSLLASFTSTMPSLD